MELEPWQPAHIAYAEKVAIRLAVEVNTGMPHPRYDRDDVRPDRRNPYIVAAQSLGAVGVTRAGVLLDLAGLLEIHGVELIGTVRQALEIAYRSDIVDSEV